MPHLETFVKIVREGSFTAASIALNLNQSSVSARLSNLEHNLGVRLLERRGGHLEVTEAGHALLPFAEQVLSAMHSARRHVRDAGRGATSRTLSIGSNGSSALALLPRVLPRYRAIDAQTTVSVEVHETAKLMELISHGAIALAFVNPLLRHSMTEVLWTCSLEVELVARKDHPLCGRVLSQADFAGQPIVTYSLGHAAALTEELRMAVGNELHVSVESNSTLMVLAAIESGMGVGFLPTRAIATQLANGTLVPIRMQDYAPRPWEIACVRWRGSRLDEPTERFLGVLVESNGAGT